MTIVWGGLSEIDRGEQVMHDAMTLARELEDAAVASDNLSRLHQLKERARACEAFFQQAGDVVLARLDQLTKGQG